MEMVELVRENVRCVIDDIIERIEAEVLEPLSDSGDDWFAASKVNDAINIIKDYMDI